MKLLPEEDFSVERDDDEKFCKRILWNLRLDSRTSSLLRTCRLLVLTSSRSLKGSSGRSTVRSARSMKMDSGCLSNRKPRKRWTTVSSSRAPRRKLSLHGRGQMGTS